LDPMKSKGFAKVDENSSTVTAVNTNGLETARPLTARNGSADNG